MTDERDSTASSPTCTRLGVVSHDWVSRVREAWNPTRRVWELRRDQALKLGLKERIENGKDAIVSKRQRSGESQILMPNNPVELTAHSARFFTLLSPLLWAAAHRERSPGRFASGRTRQLSRELLPAATRRENQELKTDAPSGHGLAAALGSVVC